MAKTSKKSLDLLTATLDTALTNKAPWALKTYKAWLKLTEFKGSRTYEAFCGLVRMCAHDAITMRSATTGGVIVAYSKYKYTMSPGYSLTFEVKISAYGSVRVEA